MVKGSGSSSYLGQHGSGNGPALPFHPSMSYQEQLSESYRENGNGLNQAHLTSAEGFAAQYTKPFCDYMTENPTIFHAVGAFKDEMKASGWKELSERDTWDIQPSGRYFVERNGSSLIAFVVGEKYKPGNGAAIIAGHIDALTAKVKPFPDLPNKAGFRQLGVSEYGGALSPPWVDRDLGIGGRVLVQEGDRVVHKLVKLDWPIARIPSLAVHFGPASTVPYNKETQMVPIVGLGGSDHSFSSQASFDEPQLFADSRVSSFADTQPPYLVRAIQKELGIDDRRKIVSWELELYDFQPAAVGGIDKEFIFAGRIDDKLCSWAAMRALLDGALFDTNSSSVIKTVAIFDDEEIGSLIRQGARGNFLPATIQRVVGSLAGEKLDSDTIGRTFANSFLVSADVTHSVNPNFLEMYLPGHAPGLNIGLAISSDSQGGGMTTDSVSTAIFTRCVEKNNVKLQVFHARNGGGAGGTVGPMLSAATGMRAIDVGIPQLSMHSIRATTGSLNPGYGVLGFMGFLNGYESVDKEFRI